MPSPPFSRPLLESEVDPDPIVQFAKWFAEAAEAVRVPEAAAVATASPDCRPSVRMVLVKRFDDDGFVFHTNYDSRKGQDIASNPYGAILFHWDALGRQVRIDGPIDRTSSEESDAYFATRPFGAQVGAAASEQSRPVTSRQELDREVQAVSERYAGRAVPRPASWGGFRLTPERIEFWQNRDDRLHDRLLYNRVDSGWSIVRLQP